jgi:hypothetical protein
MSSNESAYKKEMTQALATLYPHLSTEDIEHLIEKYRDDIFGMTNEAEKLSPLSQQLDRLALERQNRAIEEGLKILKERTLKNTSSASIINVVPIVNLSDFRFFTVRRVDDAGSFHIQLTSEPGKKQYFLACTQLQLETILNIMRRPGLQVRKDIMFSMPDVKTDTEEGVQRQESEDVVIYISDQEVPLHLQEKITNAAGNFMEALGYELEALEEPIFGSFWQKFSFLKKHVTEAKIDDAIEKGKKALELKHVDLPTAEQTLKLAEASKAVMEALKETEEGVVKLGALLIIKKQVDGRPNTLVIELPFHIKQLFDEKPQLLMNIETTWQIVTGDVKEAKQIDDGSIEVGQALQ